MAWYKSQAQNAEWKRLIQKPNVDFLQIINSQQFSVQLIKQGNPQIFEWLQKQYKFFFQQLLTRCLVLPKQSDSNDRKYKQPTQCIQYLLGVLQSMGTNIISQGNQNLPTSSISSSFNAAQPQRNQNSSNINNNTINNTNNNNNNNNNNTVNDKNQTTNIINFIVQRMFTLFIQNDINKLQNTLIPGYFYRIFECLNSRHSTSFILSLRTTQQNNKLQQLLQTHSNFQQIIYCIKLILVVQINHATANLNLQMSTTFNNNMRNSIVANNFNQPNHPYETKYRLLMRILNKIAQYKNIYNNNNINTNINIKYNNFIMLQNLLGQIIIQIIFKFNNIFEGSIMAEYICQSENCKILFQIGLSQDINIIQQGKQCQLKCLQLLKYCVQIMKPVDRFNLFSKFKQAFYILLKTQKVTIRECIILQLLNQWFLAETNQPTTHLKQNLSNSNSMSMSGSFNSGLMGAEPFNSQLQQLFSKQKIFKQLIKLCVKNSSNNIFHKRVQKFITNVFASQNHSIINSIFKQNQIITQTLSNTKNFKQNPYFGHFIQIIKTYTTRRINSPIVNQAIQKNQTVWCQFYSQLLQPHFNQKIMIILGELQNVSDNQPIQFTTVKSQLQQWGQSTKVSEEPIKIQQTKAIKNQTIQNSQPIVITLPPTDKSEIEQQKYNKTVSTVQQLPKEKQSQQQVIEPITLAFKKKQSTTQPLQQRQENQSFQNFLKRKMGQSNQAVDQRRKSRTPTKIIAGESKKKKKWGGDQQNTQNTPIRKTVSADQKIVVPPKAKQDPQEALLKISLLKIIKQKLPKNARQRKINNINDSRLLKWLQKSKKNIKNLR